MPLVLELTGARSCASSFLDVSADALPGYERLARLRDLWEPVPPALVHSTTYLEWIDWARGHDCGAPDET